MGSTRSRPFKARRIGRITRQHERWAGLGYIDHCHPQHDDDSGYEYNTTGPLYLLRLYLSLKSLKGSNICHELFDDDDDEEEEDDDDDDDDDEEEDLLLSLAGAVPSAAVPSAESSILGSLVRRSRSYGQHSV